MTNERSPSTLIRFTFQPTAQFVQANEEHAGVSGVMVTRGPTYLSVFANHHKLRHEHCEVENTRQKYLLFPMYRFIKQDLEMSSGRQLCEPIMSETAAASVMLPQARVKRTSLVSGSTIRYFPQLIPALRQSRRHVSIPCHPPGLPFSPAFCLHPGNVRSCAHKPGGAALAFESR